MSYCRLTPLWGDISQHIWLVPDGTVQKFTSKCNKMDEKAPIFFVHVPPSIFGFFVYPTTSSTHSKIQWAVYIFNCRCWHINVHHHFVSFLGSLVPTPKQLSICRALIFLFDFGTCPSKTDEELVYYDLYNEEASFYLDVFLQLFNWTFIILILILQ